MANIFSNFGNTLGNAFTNLGQGGTVFNADPAQIASLSDEDKKRFRNQGMQRFLDSLMMASAIESENPQRLATTSNMIRQRKIDQENAKAKAEKKAQQELLKQQQDAFIKANPEYQKMIQMNQLFGITPSSNKLTKSDFVVEILEKMKKNPGYELTETDQRILDTISDTDPMKIMIRNRLKEMQTSKFNNENTTQTGPVTVTTQQEFDALPSGSLFIEDGKTYRKP